MAENVLKLKVQSEEYDAKIKRAAEGIQHFVSAVRESGSSLKEDGIQARAFLQELGKMETVAKGGKQQLRELSNALVTLTDTYRGLSDAEKSTGFGQELNKQIQILTERAGSMKDAMMDVEQSINNAASDTRVFDQLSGGAQLLTASFQAATGAANLLGIEMGDNVEVIAKLQAAMGVVNGLTTIQTALQKQSAVMQGVQAVQAAAAAAAQTSYATATGAATVAQKAFNMVANANPYVLLASAVAAVGTALYAFASASSKAKKEAEELKKAEEQAKQAAEQHRQSLVNAASEAGAAAGMIASLRQSYAAANSELEKTQILQQAADQFKKLGIECKGTDDAQRLLVQEGGKVIKMIELQGEAAAIGAMRMEAYKSALASLMSDVESGQLSLSSAMTLANNDSKVSEYTKELAGIQGQMGSLKSSLPMRGSGSGRTRSTKTAKEDDKYAADSIMAQEKWIAKLEDDWKRAGANVRDEYIPMIEAAKKKLEEMKGVAAAAPEMATGLSGFNEQTISAWTSMMKDQLAKTDIGSDLYNSLTQNLSDMSTLTTAVQDAVKLGLQVPQDAVQEMFEAIFDGGSLPEDLYGPMIQKFIDDFKKLTGKDLEVGKNGSLTIGKSKEEKKEDEKQNKSFAEGLGQLTGGMQQMVGSLQQLGIDIPAGLTNVLGGIQSVVTILTTISTIVSAIEAISAADTFIPFARGGIVRAAGGFSVPGNYYSGDRVPALLNSGELVLNKAQQGNLASQLEGGGMQNLNLEAVIRGEDIRLALNNNGRRTGRGEYVQSRKG